MRFSRGLGALRLAAALLVLLGAGPARAQTQGLTIDEAIRGALSRSERARVASARVAIAEADVDRAQVGFLPSIVLSASDSQRLYNPSTGSNASRAGLLNNNTLSGSVTVTQPLLNLPAYPAYSASKRSREAARWQSQEDRRQLSFETARTFLDVLTREQVVQAARQRLEYARAQLNVARGRAGAEIASTNDVTRAEIEVASATREVSLREGDVKRAYVDLSFLINADVSPPLVTPEGLAVAAAEPAGDAGALMNAAMEGRPDLKAARERVEAAKASAREPYMRYFPTLSLAGAVRLTNDAGNTGRWVDPSIALNLSWTLYDGGQRGADRRGRDVQAEISALDASLLQRRLGAEVRSAIVTLEAAQGVFRAAGAVSVAAKRGAEEAAILYRQGLARAIEVFDSNTKRFDAEVNLASARLSMLQAYLNLRLAMGKAPLEGGAQ